MMAEDYVSFEVAKLLKEKGFDEDIARVVNEECEIDYLGSFQPSLAYLHHTWYRCPTLQMAMKWLREVYHIFIRIIQSHIEYCMCEIYYDKVRCYQFSESFNSYEEAVEAAIKYCLKNLI